MKLIGQIEAKLWENYKSYKNVEFYISKWQIYFDQGQWNFDIYHSGDNIDLKKTLHGVDSQTLIKIANDLGIETPGFIPLIPVIKNVLESNYSSAYDSFEKAVKQIEENPDVAVGLANSTLESIIKHILTDERVKTKWDKKNTLYKLTCCLLQEFRLFPNSKIPVEIKNIGSSLLTIAQNIEQLRSNKTILHGKLKDDYIINDPLFAYFVINVVSSVGLFLVNYYGVVMPIKTQVIDGSAVNPEDIPF